MVKFGRNKNSSNIHGIWLKKGDNCSLSARTHKSTLNLYKNKYKLKYSLNYKNIFIFCILDGLE